MSQKFDEIMFEHKEREVMKEHFLRHLYQWETQEVARLKKLGWKYKKTMRRRALCIAGDVPLQRKVLYKDGVWKKPLDEYLGLAPYIQYSPEVALLIVETYVDLSMRKTGKYLNKLKGWSITKDAVLRARKQVTQLYKDREEFGDYQDEETPKKEIDVLYVEGDGIWVREQTGGRKGKKMGKGERGYELAHFIISEGRKIVYGDNCLIEKHNVINRSNLISREQLENYIHNNYKITPQTLLITNSDMGGGYTANIFKDLGKFLNCRHEHFYDAHHITQNIKKYFRFVPKSEESVYFVHDMFEALARHDKKATRLILETAALQITNEKSKKYFEDFAKSLLRNFAYTKTPKQRGLEGVVIGAMESQQAIIADRMKGRKMAWTKEGGETMACLIIDSRENRLRELFFGRWREESLKIKDYPPVADYIDISTGSRRNGVNPGHLSFKYKEGK